MELAATRYRKVRYAVLHPDDPAIPWPDVPNENPTHDDFDAWIDSLPEPKE